MNRLWSYIDTKNWHEGTKYRGILLILSTLSAAAGFTVWLIVRHWTLSTVSWMLCFIGYPVIAAWFVVFFYSCRHSFHDTKDYPHYTIHH